MVPPNKLLKTNFKGTETEPKLRFAMRQNTSNMARMMNGPVFFERLINYCKGLKKKGS